MVVVVSPLVVVPVLVLVSVSAQQRVLDQVALGQRQRAAVDGGVERQVVDVVLRAGLHVQQDCAGAQEGDQAVHEPQQQRAHVRLGPAVAAALHILFELEPPKTSTFNYQQIPSWCYTMF